MADFSKLTLGGSTYDVKDSTARQGIADINTKLGTVPENSTVMGEISKAQTAATYDDTTVKADIKSNKDAIDAINDTSTGILKTSKDYTDAEVKKVTDSIGTVPAGSTVIDEIDKVSTTATAASTAVTTLIGDDASKSVRTIANEELAAQLIPQNAKESLDTLTEIANWIQNHPDDASAMNTAITNLQTLVGKKKEGENAATGLCADVAAVDKRIDDLVGGSGLGSLAYKSTVETADITDKNVTKAKLEDSVQTSLGKADTAIQSSDTFSTTANGLVPKADGAEDTKNFLRGDGTWAEPITATYDSSTETLAIAW